MYEVLHRRTKYLNIFVSIKEYYVYMRCGTITNDTIKSTEVQMKWMKSFLALRKCSNRIID